MITSWSGGPAGRRASSQCLNRQRDGAIPTVDRYESPPCSSSAMVVNWVFRPHSFGDPDGRLFRWKDALYRGISHQQAPFIARLFDEGVISALAERGLLVESEVAPLTLDGYAMVLRHRMIPFVSYPEEWPAAMLKDAALTILDLAIALAERGLTLKDGHPWNVVFDAYTPIFVDVTSIVPLDDQPTWPAYESFCRFAYYPLLLMARRHERVARFLLRDHEGVRESDVLALTGSARSKLLRSAFDRPAAALRRIGHAFRATRAAPAAVPPKPRPENARRRAEFLRRARGQVEALWLPSSAAVAIEELKPFSLDSWALKRQELECILNYLRPDSVLDVGGEAAWAARAAARLGIRAVAVCPDSRRAGQLYRDARGNTLPILSLVMDFVDPTPSGGIDGHWAIAATERLGCDLVVASSVAVRAAWERGLTVDQIVDGLSAFARRRLLLEFVAFEANAPRHPSTVDRPACTADSLAESLRRRFSRVETLTTHQETRLHVLCTI